MEEAKDETNFDKFSNESEQAQDILKECVPQNNARRAPRSCPKNQNLSKEHLELSQETCDMPEPAL